MKLNLGTLKNGRLIMSFIIIMAAFMHGGFTLKAQNLFDRETVMGASTNQQANPEGIKDFTVTSDEHTVYIEFVLAGLSDKCTFFLERSTNGTDYIVIAQKKGIASTNPMKEVQYNFTDQKPLKGISYYKIMQMKENGIMYSEVVPFEHSDGTPALLYTENKDQE
jgi:hypothetical protein